MWSTLKYATLALTIGASAVSAKVDSLVSKREGLQKRFKDGNGNYVRIANGYRTARI